MAATPMGRPGGCRAVRRQLRKEKKNSALLLTAGDGVHDGVKVVLPAEGAAADHADHVVEARVGLERVALGAQPRDLQGAVAARFVDGGCFL